MSESEEDYSLDKDGFSEMPESPTLQSKLKNSSPYLKKEREMSQNHFSMVSQYQLKLDEAEIKHPKLNEGSQISAKMFEEEFVRLCYPSPSYLK